MNSTYRTTIVQNYRKLHKQLYGYCPRKQSFKQWLEIGKQLTKTVQALKSEFKGRAFLADNVADRFIH